MTLSPTEVEVGIAKVSARLRLLEEQPRFVWIGGGSVPLHITQPVPAGELRHTKDIDAVVSVSLYADYCLLGEQLRRLGFVDDMALPIRWHFEGLMVDILPLTDIGHGMGNQWFHYVMDHAVKKTLADGSEIEMAASPVLLATKLEAFADRGIKDPMSSHDLEDILTLVDGRPELVTEAASMPADLQSYLAKQAAVVLQLDNLEDILEGNLSHARHGDQRIAAVVARLRALTKL